MLALVSTLHMSQQKQKPVIGGSNLSHCWWVSADDHQLHSVWSSKLKPETGSDGTDGSAGSDGGLRVCPSQAVSLTCLFCLQIFQLLLADLQSDLQLFTGDTGSITEKRSRLFMKINGSVPELLDQSVSLDSIKDIWTDWPENTNGESAALLQLLRFNTYESRSAAGTTSVSLTLACSHQISLNWSSWMLTNQ